MAISLGLDLSSSCCGYAFTENKQIIKAGFIDIKKQESYKEKADHIINELDKTNIKFDSITIEDSLSGFGGGRLMQVVIIKLAKTNAVISYILEENYKKEIQHINPVTARKKVFGVGRIKGIKPKDFVKQQVELLYDMSPWIILNRNGVPDKRNEDMYDGLVVSLYRN